MNKWLRSLPLQVAAAHTGFSAEEIACIPAKASIFSAEEPQERRIMQRNFTTGTAGLVAVDTIGNEVLFLEPVTYEVINSIKGFAPNVHELLISEDHTRAYVPIYGDGLHGKNPDPGHLIAIIDLRDQRHLSDFQCRSLPGTAPNALGF